jgi:stage IV sporulation protein FA
MFKLLIGACLVLASAIVFKNDSPPFEKVQQAVSGTFEEDFQFAMISKWYGDQFGDPLSLIKTPDGAPAAEKEFTAPASGTVLETFEDNGQGVMVETSSNIVEVMNEGTVVEIGEKDDSGLTVVVLHDDTTKSWYGNLEKVEVSLYDFVESGTEVGKIKTDEDQKGTYYFAIKKGDQFIDPIQVISFD